MCKKGTLLHWWPLWKTVWRFLRKLKIELIYDPATPLLGIDPDRTIIIISLRWLNGKKITDFKDLKPFIME